MQEEGLEINTRNSLLLGAIKNHAGGSHTHYFKGETENKHESYKVKGIAANNMDK